MDVRAQIEILSTSFYASINVTLSCTASRTGGPMCDRPVNLVILVDSSANGGDSEWRLIQRYLAKLVDLLLIGHDHVRLGVIQYARTTRTVIRLNDYYRDDRYFLDAISRMSKSADRDRRLNLALDDAVDLFTTERRAVDVEDEYLLIITTGKQTGPMGDHIARFRRMKPAALVYALAFGSDFMRVQVDNQELHDLVGDAGRHGDFWVVLDQEYRNEDVERYASAFVNDRYICQHIDQFSGSK